MCICMYVTYIFFPKVSGSRALDSNYSFLIYLLICLQKIKSILCGHNEKYYALSSNLYSMSVMSTHTKGI